MPGAAWAYQRTTCLLRMACAPTARAVHRVCTFCGSRGPCLLPRAQIAVSYGPCDRPGTHACLGARHPSLTSGRGTPAGGPAVSAAPLDHPLPPSHSSYACPNTYSNILPAKLTSALLLLGMPHARRLHHLHLKPHLPGAGRPRHPDPHHPHLRLTHTRWHSRWHSTHTHKGALNVARRHHLRTSSNRKKCSESYTAAMSALSHTSASNCCAQASATSASNSSLP